MPAAEPMSVDGKHRRGAWALWMLFVMGALLFGPFLPRGPLRDPDESRYAEIPREMLVRSDYVTPTLNYVPYFEKPPLQYWATMLCYRVFGISPRVARVPSAVAAVAGMLLTYVFANSIWGRRVALISAIALGTCLEYWFLGSFITLDMLLSTFVNAGLMAFYLSQRARSSPRRRLGYLGFWGFGALAVLCKGPVGVVLIFLVIVPWAALARRWAWLGDRAFWWPLPAFFLVTIPWFVAVSLKYPSFVNFFFVHEHVQRFLTGSHRHREPIWFFFVVMVAGMMPWTPAFLLGLWRAVRELFRRGAAARPAEAFAILWIAFPVLLFTSSHSKLPTYILPVFAPAAMLAGIVLSRRLASTQLRGLGVSFVVVFLAFASGPIIARRLASAEGTQQAIALPVMMSWFGLLASVLGAGIFCLLGELRRATAALACAAVFQCACVLGVATGLHSRTMALGIQSVPKGLIDKADLVVACGKYRASFGFYTGRRIVVVGSRGELSFGSQFADLKWFPTLEEFHSLWRGPTHIVAMGSMRKYGVIIPDDSPGYLLWTNGERWIRSNWKPGEEG